MKTLLLKPIEYNLTESGQQNSIRWMITKQVSEDTLTNVTCLFKCRDYFNDFVYKKHTQKDIHVYGMGTKNIVFNEDGGLFVALLIEHEGFWTNLEHWVNPLLEQNWGFSIVREDVKVQPSHEYAQSIVNRPNYLVYFPKEAFVSTYRISMVTQLLRIAHQDMKITSEYLQKTESLFNLGEPYINTAYKNFIASGNLKLKDEPVVVAMAPYKVDATNPMLIHNCGWRHFLHCSIYNNKRHTIPVEEALEELVVA